MSSLASLKHHAELRRSPGGESISGLKADKMRHNLRGVSTTSPAAQASHGDTKTRRKVLDRNVDALVGISTSEL